MKIIIVLVSISFCFISVSSVADQRFSEIEASSSTSLSCKSGTRTEELSITSAYWSNAERTFKTSITSGVRTEVLREFCESSFKLVNRKKVTFSKINTLTETVLNHYIRRSLDSEKKGRSISSILRNELDFPGFSRPRLKKFGILKIANPTSFSGIEIEGKKYSVSPRYLVATGETLIKGYRLNLAPCSYIVKINTSSAETFRCITAKRSLIEHHEK